jgi:protoheme ferro-lyase
MSIIIYYREDEYLVNMQHTVIPSWYQREGYVKAMATLIENELSKFASPQQVCCILYLFNFINAVFFCLG